MKLPGLRTVVPLLSLRLLTKRVLIRDFKNALVRKGVFFDILKIVVVKMCFWV